MKAIGEKLAVEIIPEPTVTKSGIQIVCTDGHGQRALARGLVKSVGRDCKYGVRIGDIVRVREYNGFQAEGLCYVWEKDVICVEVQ